MDKGEGPADKEGFTDKERELTDKEKELADKEVSVD
jgi:hypothetical protein